MRKYKAFTLAEVLITFGIIGLVAAMTIPTLMTNTGKSEYKTGFKKALSSINQAVTMSVALEYIDFADTKPGIASPSIYKILSDRMNVVKLETEESPAVITMFGNRAKNNYTLFFSDGTVLTYPKNTAKCSVQLCEGIIDVNGIRKPNKLSHCQGINKTNVTSDNVALGGVCDPKNNLFISDQYEIIFKNQQALPNGYAAKYVLYEN